MSTQPGTLRVILDLGATVDVSRIEIVNYNENMLTDYGAKMVDLYLHPKATGEGVPTEAAVFTPRYQILNDVTITQAASSGATTVTSFDDRALSNTLSGALSCAPCANASAGSTWPRTSVHDCACLGTHYKEWPSEGLGRCLQRLPALPPPYSAPSAGVVETGAQVNLYADRSHAYHAETTVHYTIASQPSSIPTGTHAHHAIARLYKWNEHPSQPLRAGLPLSATRHLDSSYPSTFR